MNRDEMNDPALLETDRIPVRNLTGDDLKSIVRIDAASMGRAREEYYRTKLAQALEEVGPRTSLIAEVDGHPVGFLLARVYYGEFGQAEPVAVIDSIGVDPPFRGRHVGQALLRQLLMNLRALHVVRVQTEVDWEQMELLHFLRREGFKPAQRFCLEREL